jgi:ferric-dicitrate binding protein FerR (iron transport regulator)
MEPLNGAGFAMRLSMLGSRHYFERLIGRRDALGFVATLLASLAFSRRSSAAVPAGRVEEIKGEAFADASNQHRPLEKSSSIYVGDRVETGVSSRLTMLLGEDTTIRLGERAHLVIDQFLSTTGGEISLQSGPMLFDRPSGSRPVPMKIKSPYGLIAVRGTKFFAGPSNGVFAVFVDHGTVVVSAGGGDVVLRAGEGTDLNSRGAKSTEAVKWGQARIQAAFDSVN